MKHRLLFLTFFLPPFLYAQPERDIPFIGYFGGYGIYKELKTDSLGYLSIPNIDTNIIVYISKKLDDYKMYDRSKKLISEGSLGGRKYVDFFMRFGKWTAYYTETGKPKVIGYFYENWPTGLWKYFYPSGQLRETFSLTQIEADSTILTRKVGLYEEYYENGSIKVTGFYQIKRDTTTIKTYDYSIGDFKDTLIRGPVSKPYGIWRYFKNSGELEKEEEFR